MAKQNKVRDLCLISLFAAVIAVSAQLRFPMPTGVSFTLQTLAIALAGVVLGPRRGALAVLVYILLGAFGMPVFNGFMGGVQVLFGRTGGFILSFPFLAFAAGVGAVIANKKNNPAYMAAGLFLGCLINYFFGMAAFAF